MLARWLIFQKRGDMYTEPQMFDIVARLAKIYSESYPQDKEGLERFLRWAHTQYGYEYK